MDLIDQIYTFLVIKARGSFHRLTKTLNCHFTKLFLCKIILHNFFFMKFEYQNLKQNKKKNDFFTLKLLFNY